MNTLLIEAREPAASASPAERTRPLPLGRKLLKINAWALVFVAVVLRCWQLGNIPGLNGDEAWYGAQALELVHGEDIAWATPTGNALNPFFFMPLFALHYYFPPSVVLLRLVPLASGLAVLVANYFLCRRVFDQRTALVSTLILALMPIDIAYSRFAWDASQSVLAVLFVMYLPLIAVEEFGKRAPVSALSMFAAIAAVLVHPTNAFAVALLVAPALYVRRGQFLETFRTMAIPGKSLALAAVVTLFLGMAWLEWQDSPLAVGRLHGPRELSAAIINYLRLFSGSTIYEYVSGATLAGGADRFAQIAFACDVVFAFVALLALWGLVRRLSQAPNLVDASLALGWLVMLAGFFLVAGPRAMAPHFERYAMCLIAPGALVLARGLTWWLDARHQHHAWAALALAAVAWLWPVSFYVDYFECFWQTGGRSHLTFRTAPQEPKAAALDYVLAHKRADEQAVIVCHEWWNYWPLAYLSAAHPQFSVLTADEWQGTAQGGGAPRIDNTWFVEFADSEGDLEAASALRKTGAIPRRYVLYDYAGRGVIAVIAPPENFFRNR